MQGKAGLQMAAGPFLPLGSVAVPSLRIGNVAMGFFAPDSAKVSLTIGGSEVVRWQAGGMSILTTSLTANYVLDVNGNVRVAGYLTVTDDTDPPVANALGKRRMVGAMGAWSISGGTPTLDGIDYNLDAIVDGGVGIFSVNYTTDFASGGGFFTGTCNLPFVVSKTAGSSFNPSTATWTVFNSTTGVAADPSTMGIVAFGGQ